MKPLISGIIFIFLWCAALVASKTVDEILTSDDRFRVLVQQLKRTGLWDDLKAGDKSISVFAPVNEAFEKRQETETTYSLLGQKVTRGRLLYHVLPNAVKTEELYDGELLETSLKQGPFAQRIKVGKDSGQWKVNQAQIVDADLEADNGIVHVINGLLRPPVDLDRTLHEEKDLVPFGELVTRADIDAELKRANGYTVFVTRDVFEGLSDTEKAYLNHSAAKDDLAKILKHQIYDDVLYYEDFPNGKSQYKSLQGEHLEVVLDKNNQVTVNGAKIIHRDILASNGVIHVLEKSILPRNRDFLQMNPRKALIAMDATKFVSLLDENELDCYLDTDTPYTILAPPNEAIDEGTVPRNQLENWLKYHIVSGKHKQDDLGDGMLLKTESNDRLESKDRQRIVVHVTDQDQRLVKTETKKSIQFNRVGLIGDPVSAGKSILYPIAQPLSLPRDPLNQLPTHLDLSTFVAGLYASGADEDIKQAASITLFAPTNAAFARLGLVTKHLLQPESADKLASVIKFHAVRDLVYFNETSPGEKRLPTLAGPEINVNKTKDGQLFLRGAGAGDGSDRSVIAKVVHSDMIVSNGVIHQVDRVELPSNLQITNRELLAADETGSFLRLLSRTNLSQQILDGLDKSYTLLAPSDRAFAKLNLSDLLDQPEHLLRVAKLHVLPVDLPRVHLENKRAVLRDGPHEITKDGVELPSLLSEDTKVVMTKTDSGYTVQVKGDSNTADVVNVGRSSSGGGVLVIDKVLMPLDLQHGSGGLRWWAIILIVVGVLLAAALLALIGYYGWLWWRRRREGYISLERD